MGAEGGAEVGRFERFVFLFLALFCGVLFPFFFGQQFFGVFETYRFLLEKLKVMFPFLLTQLPYV